jgi:protein MPE1
LSNPILVAKPDTNLPLELKDDNYQVPRSKSLIARRLPPANKARGGSAGKYIAGTSAALGGRDDTLDRRVEAGSRAELLAKRGISMPGLPPGKHLTARFDGKSDSKVSRGIAAKRIRMLTPLLGNVGIPYTSECRTIGINRFC